MIKNFSVIFSSAMLFVACGNTIQESSVKNIQENEILNQNHLSQKKEGCLENSQNHLILKEKASRANFKIQETWGSIDPAPYYKVECVEGIWETIYIKSKSFFDREEWESRSFSSSTHFQESSSQVLVKSPFFEEFLSQENSQKEDSSTEKLLIQEESLQKCEEKKYQFQKSFLLRICKNRLSTNKRCDVKCENGEWKVKESNFNDPLDM